MPPVRYRFTPRADRDFARLPVVSQRRVIAALDRYVVDPRTGDIKKLAGVERLFRLRVGTLRVIFELGEAGATMVVLRVLPRGRAYRE